MSEVKVNKISPRTNCGTVQLGDSGDTITIPAGATITNNGTQTGFGRTGTVDWQTSIKTSGFTAVSGEGYFCNTTGGAFTVTLPASPSVGDIVSIKDYASTFLSNNLTLGRNSSNIGGEALDAIISQKGIAVTLVYADATKGWLVTESGLQNEAATELFVAASGGTEVTCGNFKIHTFTGPGNFTVSCAGNAAGSNTVSYLVVAGGGGGGVSVPNNTGAGGGAGGFREGLGLNDSYTGSPLRNPTGVLVSAQAYPITVGAAGAGSSCNAVKGGTGGISTFSTISSAGGGGGGSNGVRPGVNGGSGGGGGGGSYNQPGGTGNTPPVSPPQGQPGGVSAPAGPPDQASGGGGGATEAGVTGSAPGTTSGRGGAGATTNISASPVAYAGGGGGGGSPSPVAAGAASPCGTGGAGSAGGTGTAGTTNRGGGGGGAGGTSGSGGNGGSGIVIIRYKFQ